MTLLYSVTQKAARVGRFSPFVATLRSLLLALLLLASLTGSWAQVPAFTQASSLPAAVRYSFANSAAGTRITAGTSIACDAVGNQYLAGAFSGTLVLGTTTLVAAGSSGLFVAKRSASTGAWLWAVQAGGSGQADGTGVAVDAAGNVLVIGNFSGTISFATSPTATSLGTTASRSLFVAKLRAATGAVAWAVQAGSNGIIEGRAVAVDAAGNAVVTGGFTRTASFDTRPTLTNLISTGAAGALGWQGYNPFVAKFGAATGTAAWAVQAECTGDSFGNGVAVDAAGNAVVTGFYIVRAVFTSSPTPIVRGAQNTTPNFFVAKFEPNAGAAVWVQTPGGMAPSNNVGNGVVVAADGSALVTGYFSGTLPLGNGLVSAGANDVFVAKLNASNGVLVWVVQAGGSDDDFGNAVAVDAAGNAVVAGNFQGTASFATRPTATGLVSAGASDVFVARFGSSNGAAAWAVPAGGSGYDFSNALTVDAVGNACIAGGFTTTALFGSQTLMGSMNNGFVAVLGGAGALATTSRALVAQPTLYPNPASGTFTLTLPPVAGATTATATLVNALGQTVNTRTLALATGGTTAEYRTAGLAAGVYALRLSAGKETATLRVVVE